MTVETDCTVWGDILTSVAHERGIVGTVVFGVCRDVSKALALGYPIFSASRFMRTGKDRVEVVEVGGPIEVGGVQVRAGDLVVGADGEMLAVNALSGLRLSRAYLRGMAARGWGRVIFLSSESALNIPVEMIDYGVTKTAVLGLSRGLAKRMAGTNVTVNAVLPGPTLSEGVVEMLKDEQAKTGLPIKEVAAKFVRSTRPSSIIRRTTTVEEVANLVVYVASPLSSGTTGAALRVDGGVVDTIA